MFRTREDLSRLSPRLVRHALTTFDSGDVLRLLGKGPWVQRFRSAEVLTVWCKRSPSWPKPTSSCWRSKWSATPSDLQRETRGGAKLGLHRLSDLFQRLLQEVGSFVVEWSQTGGEVQFVHRLFSVEQAVGHAVDLAGDVIGLLAIHSEFGE